MFFCKDIFRDVPKALSVKEIKAIPGTSNFLKRALFRTFVLFFLIASRFTPHASRVFPLFGSGYAGLGVGDRGNVNGGIVNGLKKFFNLLVSQLVMDLF